MANEQAWSKNYIAVYDIVGFPYASHGENTIAIFGHQDRALKIYNSSYNLRPVLDTLDDEIKCRKTDGKMQMDNCPKFAHIRTGPAHEVDVNMYDDILGEKWGINIVKKRVQWLG